MLPARSPDSGGQVVYSIGIVPQLDAGLRSSPRMPEHLRKHSRNQGSLAARTAACICSRRGAPVGLARRERLDALEGRRTAPASSRYSAVPWLFHAISQVTARARCAPEFRPPACAAAPRNRLAGTQAQPRCCPRRLRAVHDHRVHTDERVAADPAAMQDRAAPDVAGRLDRAILAGKAMHHAVVLDAAAGLQDQPIEIAAQARPGPTQQPGPTMTSLISTAAGCTNASGSTTGRRRRRGPSAPPCDRSARSCRDSRVSARPRRRARLRVGVA